MSYYIIDVGVHRGHFALNCEIENQ